MQKKRQKVSFWWRCFVLQVDARNDRTGEVVFKDNFPTAVAGIVEVLSNKNEEHDQRFISWINLPYWL